jgi:hypothetical protein
VGGGEPAFISAVIESNPLRYLSRRKRHEAGGSGSPVGWYASNTQQCCKCTARTRPANPADTLRETLTITN